MICGVIHNLTRLVLDSVFGKLERFDYQSTTTPHPYEDRKTLEDD